MPGADVLAANLTGAGVRQGIVSGGFSYFAEQIGERLGMDFVFIKYFGMQKRQSYGKGYPSGHRRFDKAKNAFSRSKRTQDHVI